MQLYFADVTVAQTVTNLRANNGRKMEVATYSDESERRVLDFNLRISTQVFRLLDSIYIFRVDRLVAGGGGTFLSIVIDACKRAAPKLGLEKYQTIDSDEVENLVEDADDIPEFWFSDGQGKPYLSNDRRNVWCYERCLSDENRITQKDLYDPGPWSFEDIDYRALRETPSAQSGLEELETIEEGSEDDEW